MTDINRRTFLSGLGAASALTIVPRRVLGGPGYVAAERHDPARAGRLRHAGAAPDQHRHRSSVPTCSSWRSSIPTATRRTTSTGAPYGNRNRDAPLPRGADSWGAGDTGIRAGRDVARADHGDLVPEARSAGGRHPRLRRLPRDAREGNRHPGRRQHHARSSARRHQHRGAAQGQGGDLAQAGRERPPRSAAHASRRRGRAPRRRTCSPTATRPIGTRWRRGSRPASSATCAKCTTGPTVRSGRRACRSITRRARRCPTASTGRCGRGPSPIGRTIRATRIRGLSRLVCVRRRLPRRHGPLQPVAALPHPEPRRARVGRGHGRTTRPCVDERNVSTGRTRLAGRSAQGEHRPLAAPGDGATARRSTRSGTTAA